MTLNEKHLSTSDLCPSPGKDDKHTGQDSLRINIVGDESGGMNESVENTSITVLPAGNSSRANVLADMGEVQHGTGQKNQDGPTPSSRERSKLKIGMLMFALCVSFGVTD